MTFIKKKGHSRIFFGQPMTKWYLLHSFITLFTKGAQWLSDRVLDSRPRGHGFEPHQRHCVVVLEQDTFILA